MRVSQLSLERFLQAIAEVNKTLTNDELHSKLLDEATHDTPIIDALLRELAILMKSEPSPAVEKGLAAAERDLVVLLALRAIEQAEV